MIPNSVLQNIGGVTVIVLICAAVVALLVFLGWLIASAIRGNRLYDALVWDNHQGGRRLRVKRAHQNGFDPFEYREAEYID